MQLLLLAILSCLPCLAWAEPAADTTVTKVPVIFTGGHETDPRDKGRPVVLIAAALNVPPEVFRQAFSNVKPAPAGQQPEPEQVRKNKDALLHSLTPYGITNDRLDTVSNYYRYNRSRGEMWKTVPATAYATVSNGVVTGFTITNPGSGYSSPPTIALKGMADPQVTASLSFGAEFGKNGSVKEIAMSAPAH
jgi:hypothetical protein